MEAKNVTGQFDQHDPNRAASYVALLRGVNVGGKNRLPMKALAAMFADAGCGDVRTYIQSGNVVFAAAPALAMEIPALIAAGIAERFGFQAPVVTRTAAQLRQVVARNPYLAAGAPETALHVLFLAAAPDPARIAALDLDRSPPDTFVAQGQEIYVHAPNGLGRSKLTNDYFDRTLGTISTGRNWRTVTTLLAMMEQG
jgi:uncharacterized protein (DUF1697 family)